MSSAGESPEGRQRPNHAEEIRFDQELEDRIRSLLDLYPEPRAALVPVLHLCQERWAWISAAVIEAVAERIDLSPAAVESVVSSYSMFRRQPPGRHNLRVCTTLPCLLGDADAVVEELGRRLGVAFGETSIDGRFSMSEAMCLGVCGDGPAFQVDDDSPIRLDRDAIGRLMDELE